MGFIVVGVDGSQESERSLEWGMRYAVERDLRVVAVTGYVIPWTIYITPTYDDADYARDAQEMLDACVLRAVNQVPGVDVEARLIPERPAMALTLAAQGAELLVVGARGHGALPDVHLGSVANACVNHAPCPVLVFRD
ncbi:MAG TPA: universal stress protein [Candidatus Nanopelagicales bacterium]|nr:universal stress protein [Candidatus Nanopelagicales bacterium]